MGNQKSYYPDDAEMRVALEMKQKFFPGERFDFNIWIDMPAGRFFDTTELSSLDGAIASLIDLEGPWTFFAVVGRDTMDWTYAFRRWLNTVGSSYATNPYNVQFPAFLDAPAFQSSTGLACPPYCVEPWTFQKYFVLDSNRLPIKSRIVVGALWSA